LDHEKNLVQAKPKDGEFDNKWGKYLSKKEKTHRVKNRNEETEVGEVGKQEDSKGGEKRKFQAKRKIEPKFPNGKSREGKTKDTRNGLVKEV